MAKSRQFEILYGTICVSGKPHAVPDEYKGPTTITPKVYEAQVLPTKNKNLTTNITVLKIPQYETSNPSGGKTLIIG